MTGRARNTIAVMLRAAVSRWVIGPLNHHPSELAMFDPFAVFGLPRVWALDRGELRRRYIEAVARSHPDQHTDPIAQAEAAEEASLVNRAFAVLDDDESRADALVVLLGGPTREEDKSLPPDLLAQTMELREAIEEAKAADDHPALAKLRERADADRRAALAAVAEALVQAGQPDTAAPTRVAALRRARLHLNALRYARRMADELVAGSHERS